MKNFDEWHQGIKDQIARLTQQMNDLISHPSTQSLGQSRVYPDTIESKLFSAFHKLNRGVRTLADLVHELPIEDQGDFVVALTAMAEAALFLEDRKGEALTLMMDGMPLQDVLGISHTTVGLFYKLAKHLYEHQQYEEAESAFFLLSLLNPSQTIFWIGLGHSEYCQGKYLEALLAYTFAMQEAPEDARMHLFAAKCQVALGNRAAATVHLSTAEQMAGTDTIRDQVRLLRRDLEEPNR